jgi:transcriptional regulator with GAF, ATPase, and Fis domain
LQQVLAMVAKIIQRQWITVLVRGETGTGKELIARTIHYNSSTQTQPFVEINCSTIPEPLLEAELFGYEKGAFTDAKSRKKGLFELAENGTLFLDEIGEISLAVQVKLLKAIEEKTIRRLGGTEDIQIKTRIIAATNRDLQAAMQENLFRQDLYYRLNVLTLQLPPLRERGDDVLVLARHFLSRFAEEYGSALTGFTSEAEALLKSYHWPGNVRELKHTLERVVLLAGGNIATDKAIAEAIESDTPMLLAKSRDLTNVTIEIPPAGISLDEAQKQLIEKVFEQTGWHKRRTCKALKISRPRLDRIIKKYGLHTHKRRLR